MLEQELIDFCHDFNAKMGWPEIPISRVKISRMLRYKGLCVTDGEEFYFNLSELTNEDNHDFFATLIHELIHAKLLMGKHHKKAHKHGKRFKRLAKKVEKKTNGIFTVKEIV